MHIGPRHILIYGTTFRNTTIIKRAVLKLLHGVTLNKKWTTIHLQQTEIWCYF